MQLKSQFWTAPNQLTLMRLFFIPFINICIVERRYRTALILVVIAGLSDGLDGLAARLLHQKTKLGEYLDPIADKLLLSSLFLVMSFNQLIPWHYTAVVFSRDLSILIISALLYAVGLRDFRPGIFGKVNTAFQIAAVFFALLAKVYKAEPVWMIRQVLLYEVFAFTMASAMHYVLLTGQRLRKLQASKSEPMTG
ncbi:MAG TPA: CDP-alcohol phosphatidyltransferase family protein [Candidatus Saccharimonadales bacterium]|nr:CDP-alcohol phosphatidyltransferase family protein [Candidatus Saccharimonadales bacterium]